jgi:hypothetical protein
MVPNERLLLFGCEIHHAERPIVVQRGEDAIVHPEVWMTHVRPFDGAGHAQRNPTKVILAHGSSLPSASAAFVDVEPDVIAPSRAERRRIVRPVGCPRLHAGRHFAHRGERSSVQRCRPTMSSNQIGANGEVQPFDTG